VPRAHCLGHSLDVQVADIPKGLAPIFDSARFAPPLTVTGAEIGSKDEAIRSKRTALTKRELTANTAAACQIDA